MSITQINQEINKRFVILITILGLFILVLTQSVSSIEPCPQSYGFELEITSQIGDLGNRYLGGLIGNNNDNCGTENPCWLHFEYVESSWELNEIDNDPITVSLNVYGSKTNVFSLFPDQEGILNLNLKLIDSHDLTESCEIVTSFNVQTTCDPDYDIYSCIPNPNPVQAIIDSPLEGEKFAVGQEIQFRSGSRIDYGFYNWRFGDIDHRFDGFDYSYEQNPFYTYSSLQTATVWFEVNNDTNNNNQNLEPGERNYTTITINIVECIKNENCQDSTKSICCDDTCIEPKCVNDADCFSQNELIIRTCENANTCDAHCSDNQCTISCSTDLDCDDSNSSTIDVCYSPRTCFSSCSNELSSENNDLDIPAKNQDENKNDETNEDGLLIMLSKLSELERKKIYGLILGEGLSEKELEIFLKKQELTTKELIITKNITVTDNKTTILQSITPKEGIKNIDLYLSIPKCMAEKLNEIYFYDKGYNVIADDPMVVWHFDELNDKVNINYEIFKEITDKDCQDQAIIIAVAKEIEGSVLTKKSLFSPTVLSVLLAIPLLIIVFISTKKFIKADKLHEDLLANKLGNNVFDEKTILTRNLKQIAQYIDKESTKGMSTKEIITNLKKVGWTDEMIKESIQHIYKDDVKVIFEDYFKILPK